MKTFDVYSGTQNDLQAVKNGFSWPAFFFTWLWAAANNLWVLGGALLLSFVLIRILEAVAEYWHLPRLIGTFLFTWLYLLVMFFAGNNGNNWKRKKLMLDGYTLTQSVQAPDSAAAIQVLKNATKDAEENIVRLAEASKDKGDCPNCSASIPVDSGECRHCGAVFGPGSAWKIKPTTN